MTRLGVPTAAPPRRGRRRRWLLALVAGWAVLLVVLGAYSARHSPPTVREQRTLGQALPVVDATGGRLAAAVSDQVFEIAPLHVTPGCRLTPVRPGTAAQRDLYVYVRPGAAGPLLDRLRDTLPAAWRVTVVHRPETGLDALRADAGQFVAVHGAVEDRGIVHLRVSTGCRPDDATPPAGSPLTSDAGVNRVADALHLTGVSTPVAQTLCPGGRTVTAEGAPAPADLRPALRTLVSDSAVVREEATVYGWRDGTSSTVVATGDGRVRISVSGPC